jgi:DNA-binding LacI/PurR family transcriptional regulator
MNKSAFDSISVTTAPHPSVQIAGQIREMIRSGELQPGSKLPATESLAGICDSTISTVQRALSALTHEGLLVRQRRSGTFVRGRALKLNSIGIYFPCDPWSIEEYSSKRAIVAALKELGAARDIRMSHWIDPRPIEAQGEPWSELVSAIQTSQIDGLIVPLADWPHLNWLDKLQVPRVFAATAPLPRAFAMDYSQLVKLSLQAAVDQGARSIGIISPLGAEAKHPDGSPHPEQEFFLEFIHEAHAKGLAVKNEWVFTGKDDEGSRDQKMWAYRRMHELWAQPTHPEALVVFPDTSAEGAVMALLELGVRVPRDLKLVLGKNEEIPLFCPMPAEFIVLSLRAVAKDLIDAVEAQFYGRPHAKKPFGFRRQGSPVQQKKQ